MPIHNNILGTIGRTPLVKLSRISAGLPATVAVKCEFFNPLGSVKDRIGAAMIEAGEKEGKLPLKPPSSSRLQATPGSPLLLSQPQKDTKSSSLCPKA